MTKRTSKLLPVLNNVLSLAFRPVLLIWIWIRNLAFTPVLLIWIRIRNFSGKLGATCLTCITGGFWQT